MFDPLIKHYQRLSNIKPSAEISSVFSGSKKRRKRQQSATGYSDRVVVQRNTSFDRYRRPHSSIVFSGNTHPNADNNNNYNGLHIRRNSSNNLNNFGNTNQVELHQQNRTFQVWTIDFCCYYIYIYIYIYIISP